MWTLSSWLSSSQRSSRALLSLGGLRFRLGEARLQGGHQIACLSAGGGSGFGLFLVGRSRSGLVGDDLMLLRHRLDRIEQALSVRVPILLRRELRRHRIDEIRRGL